MLDGLKRFFFGIGNLTVPPERAAAAGNRGGTLPTSKRMYASAAVNRLTQDWISSVTSADSEVLSSRPATIARARQLERDNAWMEKLLSLWENNIIGDTALKLESKVKSANGDRDDHACSAVEAAWEEYGRQEHCTVTRSMSRRELLYTTVRAWKRDSGALFRRRRGFDNAFGYALEPLEIDRLDFNYNVPTGTDTSQGNLVKFGVEYDSFRAPVAYHLLVRHPGDPFAYFQTIQRIRERVPSDEIILVGTRNRFEQTLGMPKVTSIMPRLNLLDKYEQAEAVAAFIASCKSGFLEKTNPDANYGSGATDDGSKLTMEIQPGMVEELPAYVSYKPNDPQHPTDAFSDFIKTELRGVASGAGVPYNDLANDLENVNFSSIRSGTLEARMNYTKDQNLLSEQLMTPWFEDWLFFALLAGKVKGYGVLDYDRLKEHCWQGQRWPWVDPLKDVQANIEAINANLTSPQRVISEGGQDLDEVYQALAKSQELLQKYGLEDKQETEKAKADTANGDDNEENRAIDSLLLLGNKRNGKIIHARI